MSKFENIFISKFKVFIQGLFISINRLNLEKNGVFIKLATQLPGSYKANRNKITLNYPIKERCIYEKAIYEMLMSHKL